jgi:hypothetical protein
MNNQDKSNNFIDMENLLLQLKNEDKRTLRIMKNFKWMFFVMIFVYTMLMIVNPDPDLKLHQRISGVFYVLSFIYFAFLFRKYNNEFGNIDYSVTTTEMLKQAAERYKLTFTRYFYTLPPILFIDAGLTISLYYGWTSIQPINRVLIIQAFFIPIMLISGFIGYIIWQKRQKPLYKGALNMLEKLNEL